MKHTCMVILFQLIVMTMACHSPASENGTISNAKTARLNEEGTNSIITFTTFQNADKTWGFTVFVNNVPFRNYKTIPYRNEQYGFASRKEAEIVAVLFVKMIKDGIQSPKLTKNLVDSLGLK